MQGMVQWYNPALRPSITTQHYDTAVYSRAVMHTGMKSIMASLRFQGVQQRVLP